MDKKLKKFEDYQSDKDSKTKTSKFRKRYYDLGDAIYGFDSITKSDDELMSYSTELHTILDKIKNHLDTKYIWD